MPARLGKAKLEAGLADLKGWKGDQDAIRKAFKFKDHITAMGFVVRVGMAAEVMDHHPDLRIVYSTVDIALSTHDAGGVTSLDLELAEKIDGLS